MQIQQQKDLADLNALILKIKLDTFSFMSHVSKMSIEHLNAAGYNGKTNAEAMKIIHDGAVANIEKHLAKFERKYPN